MSYSSDPWNPQPVGAAPAPTLPARDESAERAARRTVWLLGTGVAVLAVGMVVFVTVRTLRSGEGSTAPVVTTPEDAARVVGGIGPPAGTEVNAYIDARRSALATAAGDRVAVVSLSAYTTEAAARAAVAPGEVLGLLAAAPGGQPGVVTGDLSGWVQEQTAQARAEREEIQRLIPTVEDANFKRFYQAEFDRLNQVIAGSRPNGDLVFAVIVRASAADLQQIAGKGQVRLVDVGPDARPRPAGEYRGLRPEETERANQPDTRPA